MDEDMDCPHIVDAAEKLKLDVEQIRATLNNRSCNVCLRVDQLWMCMECRQILCGHNAAGHSTAHYEFHQTHCIFINVESAAIFCFKCNSDIEPKNHDDELNRLRQFILYNRGPSANNSGPSANNTNKKRRRRKAPKAAKPKKNSLKRGPRANKKVCIPNNENDCFMNTVSQALSEQEPQTVIPNTVNNSKKPLKAVVPKKALKAKPKKPFFKRGPRTNKKVGISNSGNNCFMNAVWQSLRHLKPFIYCMKLFKLAEICHQNNNNSSDPRLQHCIAQELWKLLMTLVEWQKPAGYKFREAISPTALLSIVCKIKPRYKGFHQHDAHEFLMFTLDTLHSELKDEKSKLLLEEGITNENPNKIDTLVSMMFRGFLLSEVCCLNCNTPSRTRDPITDISLDVPDYKNADPSVSRPVDLLTDCLARYFEIEELNEKNFYYCDKCESQQRSTKRFWINALPNVFCLHLKRFRWEETYRTKVHTHIKFPMESLDMSQYLDNEMKKVLVNESSYLFDLVAVVVHDGEGGGSGHYTSYALDEKEDQWYEYNDEKVHEVDASLVENVQAYMLFYIKREMRINFTEK
ncbi:ubiquitin carboxyl-terminal hydrolase 3-like [Rhopalosiphum maidis]|uniref:ubiquitin carboxyl-terminal hydrolase 3-like n=1 Tax=Rhopalosiphum maidis TaxID=43146 RepID=UPI000F0083A8|nr:ubiquitin carboxyl-terminal hydrolase 3-like [Rhopalosiphum maidis]XP_026819180.1 ubiquitin carboxyl-terminal hydrolase 3-like [Rhopalosiphum maidis]